EEQLGKKAKFLLPDTVLEGMLFEGEVLDISLPIKMQFKVIQAPPGVQGDRAQGGTKTVILEGGVEIAVPLFVQEDDAVEVNTEMGEYVRRMPAGGEAKQD
ncbi:elongation factor P, partial [Patescibacteria group bacterium]|nr:elongation factor P [Patescibacteria group bacterium]